MIFSIFFFNYLRKCLFSSSDYDMNWFSGFDWENLVRGQHNSYHILIIFFVYQIFRWLWNLSLSLNNTWLFIFLCLGLNRNKESNSLEVEEKKEKQKIKRRETLDLGIGILDKGYNEILLARDCNILLLASTVQNSHLLAIFFRINLWNCEFAFNLSFFFYSFYTS